MASQFSLYEISNSLLERARTTQLYFCPEQKLNQAIFFLLVIEAKMLHVIVQLFNLTVPSLNHILRN